MIVAGALLCLTLLSPSLRVSPDSEEVIKQLERDRQAAFVRNDVARLEQETAEDYTTINAGGGLAGKAQMMSNLRAHKTQVLSVTLDDLKARIYDGGSVAILTGHYHDVHVTNGARAEANALFTRVFVKTDGAWRAVAYQQTTVPAA
jgi:ketosteroid isomerase-like protein